MIRLYAIAALLALALGLGWQGHRQKLRALAAENALASATAQLVQVRLADQVHRAYLATVAGIDASYDALTAEFETMEGADAPLSDYLRALDDRLQ